MSIAMTEKLHYAIKAWCEEHADDSGDSEERELFGDIDRAGRGRWGKRGVQERVGEKAEEWVLSAEKLQDNVDDEFNEFDTQTVALTHTVGEPLEKLRAVRRHVWSSLCRPRCWHKDDSVSGHTQINDIHNL